MTFALPKTRTSYGVNFNIRYQGAKIWNAIIDDINPIRPGEVWPALNF